MADRRERGFTLVEVMMVVAIVGLLGSVAIPSFHKLSLRAKAAERAMLMPRIKRAIEDYYVRTGSALPPGSGGTVSSGFNPPFPPTSAKRLMSTTLPGWNTYFASSGGGSSLSQEIQGGVYYSYTFVVEEQGGSSSIDLYVAGDLDGDGIVTWRYTIWNRIGGLYLPVEVFPAPGQEDDATYGSF